MSRHPARQRSIDTTVARMIPWTGLITLAPCSSHQMAIRAGPQDSQYKGEQQPTSSNPAVPSLGFGYLVDVMSVRMNDRRIAP